MSNGYLSDLERGVKQTPSADVLARLAATLGTSIAYLAGETDDPSPPNVDDVEVTRADMPLPPPGWEDLSDDEKERVREITKRFEETIIADILRKRGVGERGPK